MSDRSSFSKQAWRRLRRNKGAVAGMLLIGIALIVSVLAYILAPDGTPYANRMMLETGGQRPGTHIQVLALQKEQPPERTGLFTRLLNGQEETVTYIPIRGWRFSGNDIIIDKYLDEEETITEKYSLSRVIYGKEVPVTDTRKLQQEVQAGHIREQTYWLGSDKFGRDILSRLLVGTRVSLRSNTGSYSRIFPWRD